jgi:hypothetical protein
MIHKFNNMQVINVVISKEDTVSNTLAINQTDSAAPDGDVNTIVDYATLDAGQKATADAFYALALSLIPVE